jgi:tRNA(adenine34) deaminase
MSVLKPDHDRFMRLAIEEGRRAGAEGNLAIGSVIIRGGAVIGTGRNTIHTEGDPTNHAEMAAIRHACGSVGASELAGATLYTTMEPCPMCLWAICLAGIRSVVIGARHADMQPPRVHYGSYAVEALLSMTGRDLDIVSGVLARDCIALRDTEARP